MKKHLLPAFVLGLILIFSCENEDLEWVTIDPIQCMGNPWELAWGEEYGEDYDLWSELGAEGQMDVFETYYEDQGVVIHEIKTSFPYDAVCAACSCPRGDRIHCSVSEEDVDQMLELGFELE